MKAFDRLLILMRRLRHPRRGCPWDRQQTPASLKEFVLEEAYELIEAIDDGGADKIRDELGDLLLQIVFLARIFQERGEFSMADVVRTLSRKLVDRHPHIFAGRSVESADEVKANWERIKMAQRKKASIISNYPEQMPALLKAQRIASQASAVGFDWGDARGALLKVEEEIAELKAELKRGDVDALSEEVGDLLFAVANVSRLLKVNAEFALNHTNRKFTRRFRYIEGALRRRGKSPEESDLQEMEKLWQRSKL